MWMCAPITTNYHNKHIYKQIIPMLLILYEFFPLYYIFHIHSFLLLLFFLRCVQLCLPFVRWLSSEQWFLWLANNDAAIHWNSFILCVALFKSSLLLLLFITLCWDFFFSSLVGVHTERVVCVRFNFKMYRIVWASLTEINWRFWNEKREKQNYD